MTRAPWTCQCSSFCGKKNVQGILFCHFDISPRRISNHAFRKLCIKVLALPDSKAGMLSPEGLKLLFLRTEGSFPNISTRGSEDEIYCLWPIWPPRELNKAY